MIGLREYARHRKAQGLPGGTLQAVQRAISSKRLSASVVLVGDVAQIRDAAWADLEWEKHTDPTRRPYLAPRAVTPWGAICLQPAPSLAPDGWDLEVEESMATMITEALEELRDVVVSAITSGADASAIAGLFEVALKDFRPGGTCRSDAVPL